MKSYLCLTSVGFTPGPDGKHPEKGLVSSGEGNSATERVVKAILTHCSSRLPTDVHSRFTIIADVDDEICRLVAADLAKQLKAERFCELPVARLGLTEVNDSTLWPRNSRECAFTLVVADRQRITDFCQRTGLNYEPPQGWLEIHVIEREESSAV